MVSTCPPFAADDAECCIALRRPVAKIEVKTPPGPHVAQWHELPLHGDHLVADAKVGARLDHALDLVEFVERIGFGVGQLRRAWASSLAGIAVNM